MKVNFKVILSILVSLGLFSISAVSAGESKKRRGIASIGLDSNYYSEPTWDFSKFQQKRYSTSPYSVREFSSFEPSFYPPPPHHWTNHFRKPEAGDSSSIMMKK